MQYETSIVSLKL